MWLSVEILEAPYCPVLSLKRRRSQLFLPQLDLEDFPSGHLGLYVIYILCQTSSELFACIGLGISDPSCLFFIFPDLWARSIATSSR